MGGKVVFISPVETLPICDIEIWSYEEIPYRIGEMKPGQVIIVRRADVESMDLIACSAIVHGNVTVAIDELDKYNKSKDLIDLVHYSRHVQCNIVTNTRRYADCPRLITSQSDYLCVFQTNEPRDIDYLKHFMDLESVEIIRNLKKYEYLIYPGKKVQKTCQNT